jgi:D-threo-aldose 1-dehydrogenase
LRQIGKTDLYATQLGFGSAPLGNLLAVVAEADARGAVVRAWENGCRLFDTAPFYGYGLAERRLGDVLREHPRDAFVLSTKVGRLLKPGAHLRASEHYQSPLPFHDVFDYSYDAVMRSIECSLQRLGLERIDIALFHDLGRVQHGERHPEFMRQAMDGGYRALAELKAAGQIAAIGLGVNEVAVCEEAMGHADFDCFLLAGRYTLLEQAPLDRLLPACQAKGISILIGGAFNSGLLARMGRPDATYNYGAVPPEVAHRANALLTVCNRHGVPLPAAALQFPLAHPAVASVVAGARTRAEVDAQYDWMRLKIPAALWDDLRAAGLLHADAPVPE